MKNMTTTANRFKSTATAVAAAIGLFAGGFAPNKADAGFEDVYYDNYQYFASLYSVYGYDYYTYYLGLAIPNYYYFSAVYYAGYYSVYSDGYGEKGAFDSYGLYIFETYAGAGDSYFLNYY